MPFDKRHVQQKYKNWTLLIVIVLMVVSFFIASMIKIAYILP